MKIGEFFRQPVIQLPTRWDSAKHFVSFIESLFSDYLALLGQINEPTSAATAISSQMADVNNLCSKLRSAINAMLAGQPSDAYAQLASGLNSVKPLLEKRTRADLRNADISFLYRVRKHIGPSLSREDLFHIPFEKRHKVASQRYSIPGLPCLYLSGSVYTCWAEMGQPAFHELQAAAFWLDDGASIKLVNMSERPVRLQHRLTPAGDLQTSGDEEFFVTHALLWPLFAACSVRVKERGDPFKPEYIIPQLLLQWIAKQPDFDGVFYFSTHVDGICRKPLPPGNLVFPAKESKLEGRCPRLRALFRMTQPHAWQLLASIGAGTDGGSTGAPTFDFSFLPGVTENYAYTEFGRVEQRLNKLGLDIQQAIRNGDADLGKVAE